MDKNKKPGLGHERSRPATRGLAGEFKGAQERGRGVARRNDDPRIIGPPASDKPPRGAGARAQDRAGEGAVSSAWRKAGGIGAGFIQAAIQAAGHRACGARGGRNSNGAQILLRL